MEFVSILTLLKLIFQNDIGQLDLIATSSWLMLTVTFGDYNAGMTGFNVGV